jgi:hypothetical protein
MANSIDRREFLKLAGVGGIVFASGLPQRRFRRRLRRLLFRPAFGHALGIRRPA